ncbi:hypothetical protein Tco_1043724 [Tanacetum coccineum]|uniref:Uncharacterized protein n=1 Tax=Tanacetum coccineum TaxID=301880 RepID=A0ABQ5GP55_9ASTR
MHEIFTSSGKARIWCTAQLCILQLVGKAASCYIDPINLTTFWAQKLGISVGVLGDAQSLIDSILAGGSTVKYLDSQFTVTEIGLQHPAHFIKVLTWPVISSNQKDYDLKSSDRIESECSLRDVFFWEP